MERENEFSGTVEEKKVKTFDERYLELMVEQAELRRLQLEATERSNLEKAELRRLQLEATEKSNQHYKALQVALDGLAGQKARIEEVEKRVD